MKRWIGKQTKWPAPAAFTWQIARTDDEWQAYQAVALDAKQEPQQVQPRQRLLTWSILGVMTVVVMMGSILLNHPERLKRAKVEADLATAIAMPSTNSEYQHQQLEEQAHPQRHTIWPHHFACFIEHRCKVLTELDEINLYDDLAQVDLTLSYQAEKLPAQRYREIRFYRNTTQGWQPTVPNARFWGTKQTIEMNLFRIHFYERDQAVVREIVDRIEWFYSKLHTDFNLPIPTDPVPDTDTLTFISSLMS